MVLGASISLFQQITGINVILYYGPVIFENMGSDLNGALLLQLITGAINMIFTLIAIATIDKLGRKKLWIIGSIGMGFGITGVGFTAFFEYTGVYALVPMLLFIASFAMSLGPVTWVLLSELFPNRIRGRAMSIAVAIQWLSNFLVSITFPIFFGINAAVPFWLYGFFCIGALLLGIYAIPETKGKTLEEIEELWIPKAQETAK